MATTIPKPTVEQSLKDMLVELRKLWPVIANRLGFIYLTIVLVYITVAVFTVSQTLQLTDIGAGTATNQSVSEYIIPFDKDVILKIDNLSADNSSPTVVLPHGRINPFSESSY